MSGMPVDGEDVSSLFGQLSIIVMLVAIVGYFGISGMAGMLVAVGWVLVIAASLFSPVGPRMKWSSPNAHAEYEYEVSE